MNDVSVQNLNIESMIYEINGKQVMLDSDLAKLYGCKNGTKEINQAVKNNPEKFPDRFSWKLSNHDLKNLQSKFLTANINSKSRVNPRVFTEQGVAMLATILKTNIATKTSINIMDAFVKMRRYISNDVYRLLNIETKVLEHDAAIKLLQESFEKIDKKKKTNDIYYDGQIYDAYSKIQNILKTANKEIVIIDSYADNTILDIVKRLDVQTIIITRNNNLLTKQDIEKYNKQYKNLKVIFSNTFHDRYFILDYETLYHCGASINRIGYKTFSINLINDEEISTSFINKVYKMIT